MPDISLSWLGPIAATIDGRPVRFRTRKAQAMLIYLTTESALRRGAATRRETLLGLLWPDYTERSARQSLRTNLSYLKKGIKGLEEGEEGGQISFLLSDSQHVEVNPAVPYHLDLAIFVRLLDECTAHEHDALAVCAPCLTRLERASELYRGAFLADFSLPDSNAFETWVLARREALRQQALDALATLTAARLADAQFEAAERYARRQLEIDPLRESAHQQLIEVLASTGRRPAALGQYEVFAGTLRDELDIDPSVETQRLAEQIRIGVLEASVQDQRAEREEEPETEKGIEVTSIQPVSPSETIPMPMRNNLPAQPTPFIGREAELAALDKLLADPESRLVTIVGPGGMGKTRLALAAAERLMAPVSGQATGRHRFENGLYFVSLAPLSAPEQIVPTIAELLGIRLQSDTLTPKQQLLGYLRDKRLLLLVDDFGHLLEGAEIVGDVVQGAQGVQVMVTSRERLHLVEEQVFAIQGLAFLDWDADGEPADVDAALNTPAARLFLQSARRLQHDFTVTSDQVPDLTRICRLVEGMPLAVELAAAWVDTLSLVDIETEIQNGLDFLETEWRDGPQRHRSMRATIDRSWRRLSRPERELFRRMSVFRGGFTRWAAQQVAGATLRTLSSLVGKSLLSFDKENERYQIHELLRQYGEEKLADRPEQEEAVQQRHATTYLIFLAEQEPGLKGAQLKGAMRAIMADIDNIRRAWQKGVANDQEGKLKHAGLSLFLFYQFRGWHLEGNQAFGHAVSTWEKGCPAGEASGPLTTSCFLLAQALDYQGYFLVRMGHTEQAIKVLEKSLTILRQAPDETKWETAFCLIHYGGLFQVSSHFEQALSHYRESEALFRETGDPWGLALALLVVAQIHHLVGQYDEGRRLYQESQALLERIGERYFVIYISSNLARIAYIQGAYEDAEAWHRQCWQLRQEMDDLGGVALTLTDLGDVARVQRDYAEAERRYLQSLSLSTEIAFSDARELALLGLSRVANERSEYEKARAWQKQGLALAQEASHLPWRFHLEAGTSARGLGDYGQAKRSFQEALKLVYAEQIARGAVEALAGLAALEAKKGDRAKAIEWLALASSYAAAYADEKRRYRQLMAEISAGLPADTIVAAEKRGLALDLWQTVKKLLAELAAID